MLASSLESDFFLLVPTGSAI